MGQNISPCKKVIERLKLFEWLIKFLQVQLKIGDELRAARRQERNASESESHFAGTNSSSETRCTHTFLLLSRGEKTLVRGCPSFS